MTLRTVIALMLLLAQLQWAHASVLPVASVQGGAPAHLQADVPGDDAQAPPCHGAGAGESVHTADPATPASHDPAGGDTGCCSDAIGGDAPCGAAGCQCACSAAPPLSLAAVQAPLTLWVIGGTVAPVPAPPVARPSSPFRPPI